MTEAVIFISFFSLFILSAILWFFFSYGVIPKIDKRMEDAGESRACPTDIMGLRVLMIATAIGVPMGNLLNHDGNPLIDARSIRPYALKKEKMIGTVLVISFYSAMLIGMVGSFFIPEI
ncbi:hypothetical protein [Thalassolituus sp.]|uniref:hypothetical protein n=1 Tax=Thalassolituus sp. TaxID=2030822 RepID=UPI0035156323